MPTAALPSDRLPVRAITEKRTAKVAGNNPLASFSANLRRKDERVCGIKVWVEYLVVIGTAAWTSIGSVFLLCRAGSGSTCFVTRVHIRCTACLNNLTRPAATKAVASSMAETAYAPAEVVLMGGRSAKLTDACLPRLAKENQSLGTRNCQGLSACELLVRIKIILYGAALVNGLMLSVIVQLFFT